MTENVMKFTEYLSSHEDAKKEFDAVIAKAGKEAFVETTIKFAAEKGFTITEDDFKPKEGELNSQKTN